MESFFSDNAAVLFVVALFYAAVAGSELTTQMRVALVYAFFYLALLFSVLDRCAVLVGSLLVLFLVLEVFSTDRDRVKMFSVPYKLIDFAFRMIVEYYAWLYLLLVCAIKALDYSGLPAHFVQLAGVAAMMVLLLMLSRAKFAIKPISEMMAAMTKDCSAADYGSREPNRRKYLILAQMEDREFFDRGEMRHIPSFGQVGRGLINRMSLGRFRHPVANCKELLKRGYGTIEMQLIRTVGIEFGSYSCRIRRKLFELVYAQMVFNSYARCFGKSSGARNHLRGWIAQSYINNVSVRFAPNEFYPDGKSTVERVFGRPLRDLSDEEFFVWCLGLPYYENGVGAKAIAMHADIVDNFGLSEHSINEAIARVDAQD